jgi:hypothetical protein
MKTKGGDKNGGVLEIRAHTHFTDGDAFIDQGRIANFTFAQDRHQHVPDIFPCTQLALSGAGRMIETLCHDLTFKARAGIDQTLK